MAAGGGATQTQATGAGPMANGGMQSMGQPQVLMVTVQHWAALELCIPSTMHVVKHTQPNAEHGINVGHGCDGDCWVS